MSANSENAWRRRKLVALGILGYVLLALLLTYPLVMSPTEAVISHWQIDTEHSLWIQWWFGNALESAELQLFRTDLLRFPHETNLEFADINFAVNVPSYLLSKGVGAIAAHNLMLWLSFVASACSMWAFAARSCGDRQAAWLAGVVYAASAYWISSAANGWAYLIHIWVFPLTLLAWQTAGTRGRMRDFALSGVAMGISFHVSPYYFLFLGTLLAALFPWYARQCVAMIGSRSGRVGLGVGLAAAAAIIVPRAIPMLAAGRLDWFVHSGPLNTELAANLLEWVVPSVARLDRAAYGMFLVVFLGYTVPLVTCVGLGISDRRRFYAKWLVTSALMGVLALGPSFETGAGLSDPISLPGYWLGQLPGFRFITNHWRWSLLVVFCLAMAFSFAVADLRRLAARRFRFAPHWICASILAAYLVELVAVFPFPFEKTLWVQKPDRTSLALSELDSVQTILDMRSRPKWHQITHQKRIVGGWLPRLESQSVSDTRDLLAGVPTDLTARAQYLGELKIDAWVRDDGVAFLVEPDTRGRYRLRRLTPR